MKTLPKNKQVIVGTRDDGVQIIYVGANNNTPNFFIVYEGEEVPEEIDRGYTIDQILKFGQPDEWNIDWGKADKLTPP